MVTKRSARAARTQTTGQARALVLTGPDDLRLRFAGHTPAGLVAELAALRPRAARPVWRRADSAAMLLIAAGDHPERLRSQAPWAHLCATAPIPASSGKVTRHRLNPGGDRQASHALWRIVLTRMGSHPPTRAYVARRAKEGLPGKRSSAASNGTSPARSTRTCARHLADAH